MNELIIEENLSRIVSSLVNTQKKEKVRFAKVRTITERIMVGQFRREVYTTSLPYMLDELTIEGWDTLDEHANIFAAWMDDTVIATIRLCEHPFESLHLLEGDKLEEFLGRNYQHDHLEWSRLLIHPKQTSLNLLPAILIFSGLYTLSFTNYKKYFGYSKPVTRRLFKRFQLDNQSIEFSIPHRGNHSYLLLKGNFASDLKKLREHHLLPGIENHASINEFA